ISIDATTVNPNIVGSYPVFYSVTDSSGNPDSTIRTVDVVDTTSPTITLIGTTPITVEVGSAYVELGATATDNYDGDLTGSIVVDASAVNTSMVGTYVVTYDVIDTNGNNAAQVTRTVEVVDTTAPTITLVGATPVTVEVGSAYIDAGATATDSYDGDLTGSIVTVNPVNTALVGTYTVTYDVVDANGNAAGQVTRTVNVVDTTAPVITLVGINPQLIEVGAAYTEQGAAAFDSYDGALGVVIDASAVNTAVIGSYLVTYDVVDSSGNAATRVTRTVIVGDSTPPVITLLGTSPVTVELGSPYGDAGATAFDVGDGDLTPSMVTVNPVDTSAVGVYTITYNVSDSSGNAAAQVNRMVEVVDTPAPPNSAPVARNDAYSLDEGATLRVSAPGLLSNDTDADGDPLTVAITTSPANGVLTLNADGSFTYTHTGADATDDRFTYAIDDSRGGRSTAQVTIDVVEVNLPPVAVQDNITVLEDNSITIYPLANDEDPEGAKLTLTSVKDPVSGVVGFFDSTSLFYTPVADFHGTVELAYTVSDPVGNATAGTIVVTVMPVNDAPVARPDAATASSYQALVLDVLSNDTDVDGDQLHITSVSNAEHGMVEVLNTGQIQYTPDNGFVGSDTLVYKASDGNGASSVSTVTIEILPSVLVIAGSMADGLGVNRLAFQAAPALFEVEGPTLTLFKGVSLLADSFFQSVLALQMPLVFLAIAAAAALFFGRSPGMPLLASRRRRYRSVVMIDREGSLKIYEAPSFESPIIAKFDPTAGAIQTVGTQKSVDGTNWIEIVGREGTGWVEADHLTEEVDLATFMEDDRPAEMVRRLAVALEGNGHIERLLGPRGLIISADRSLVTVATNTFDKSDLPTIGGPGAGQFDGADVAPSFLAAYKNTPHVTPKTPHSTSALIPVPLWNFHYVAVPGTSSNVPWLVYFEYRNGKPYIVALGADW
ncbi:MAG: DUF5011 domain-containing protein, partial [Acidimicrobiia bacterium]|nr:DUF5011 domain-containing protein [Acidimicrobiia bacterium]